MLSDADERRTPWILWPFVAVWKLLTLILEVTGRIISAALGRVFMAVGVTVSLTVVGAPLGVPIAALGMLLLVRSLF